ncbi:MAG TPA: hypothetical protein PK854_12535 [Oscillospiraceae bacterium]|nr:hypothetical protein [Oscillospiraceae bacterium]HPS36078.1 hypothetical protein [Oscillospiraceae bacterium]
MKRYKYCFLIGFAVLFAFSACMQTPQSSETSNVPAVSSSLSSAVVSETSSVVNSVVNSAETTINLEEQFNEDELIEILSKHSENAILSINKVYEYPSPDKTQKFIEVMVTEGTPDYWIGDRNFIFLNDFDHFFYVYDNNSQESVGAVWIDIDTAAIAAEFIINLKTGEKTDMGKTVINHWYLGMIELHMRSGLYVEELDSLIYVDDYDMVFYLFQFNLKDRAWKELAERPFDTEYFANSGLHFKRENENEVSFNTEKKQRLSYNFYTKEFREIPYVGEYYGK